MKGITIQRWARYVISTLLEGMPPGAAREIFRVEFHRSTPERQNMGSGGETKDMGQKRDKTWEVKPLNGTHLKGGEVRSPHRTEE